MNIRAEEATESVAFPLFSNVHLDFVSLNRIHINVVCSFASFSAGVATSREPQLRGCDVDFTSLFGNPLPLLWISF